ncbi:MAG TPA: AsmA family protein [Rhizobacter sp.]|nr:AsmA family protein [Rhizobacter sp.]
MTSGWIRKLLLALGALVLVFVAALVWLAASFDANAYKGQAIDWVKTHRDRTLVIDGPLKLSVFPRLALQMSDVKLSEKGRADAFLTLNEAALSVAVWPLLRQQVVVDRIDARGVHLNYQRNAKGEANFDDLLGPKAAQSPATAASSSSTPTAFDISRIRLEDLHLSLRDEQAHWSGEVTLNSLTTGRLKDGVETPIELKAQLALQSPAIQGQLTGKTLLTPGLAKRSVAVRDMKLSWQGKALGLQAMDATLQGSVAYDGASGALQVQGLDLSGGASSAGLKLVDSKLSLRSASWQPAAKSVALSGLALKLAGTQAEQPMTLGLDWPELAVTGSSIKGSALSGQFSLQGPTPIQATFKAAAPAGTWDRIELQRLEATFKSQSKARLLTATLQADLQFRPAQAALALQALGVQAQWQQGTQKPLLLSLQGKADASSEAAHWAVSGKIDDADFSSDGSAILATEPLTLKASARMAALDLNRWLPASAASAPAPTGPGPAGAAADAPVDLSALRSLQGQFNVHVGQLAYKAYRISDAVLEATLEGGMLRVSQLAGKAWGGSVSATAFADARASRVAIKGAANGVNINALLKAVANKDTLEGTGRVQLDVDTAGRSTSEMKSRLKGTAALQLHDGAIKGINLAKSLRQAKAVLQMQQDTAQASIQTEKTDFSELSASFAITDGVARSSDLDVKSPFLRLGGDGLVDVGKSRIDYTARATVASTAKGQGGADLADLKGLTLPVRLTGPLDAMEWHIQWSAVAAAALKTQILDKAQDKLKERLREQLGLPGPASAASGASADTSDAAAKDKLKQKLKGLFK